VPIRDPNQGYQVWADAFNSGDIEALVALYMPDAIFMVEPGRYVSGKEAICPALEGLLALKVPITIGPLDVAVVGDIAQARGPWALRGTGADGNRST
jgi:uncharacterized protein (TIGR02246 family)